jgi:hypothetical protein
MSLKRLPREVKSMGGRPQPFSLDVSAMPPVVSGFYALYDVAAAAVIAE